MILPSSFKLKAPSREEPVLALLHPALLSSCELFFHISNVMKDIGLERTYAYTTEARKSLKTRRA